MADNLTQTQWSASSVIAFDDISGVLYQRMKNGYGPDGSYSDIATNNGMPMQGARTTKTATITSGQSLSAAIDIEGYENIAIQMPAAWTTANLTFQGSYDGVTYNDIYDSAGNELVAVAAASRCIADMIELAPFSYLKIRSGTTSSAVNQGADRSLQIICKF